MLQNNRVENAAVLCCSGQCVMRHDSVGMYGPKWVSLHHVLSVVGLFHRRTSYSGGMRQFSKYSSKFDRGCGRWCEGDRGCSN
jgi:hypothetical protein